MQGRGQGGQRRGQGRGGGGGLARMGGTGIGPSGSCVCPSCGTSVPHQRGNPCYQRSCPKCGSPMIRST